MNRGQKYFQKVLLGGNINGDIYMPACFCQHAYQCVNGKIYTLLQKFLAHKKFFVTVHGFRVQGPLAKEYGLVIRIRFFLPRC